VRELLKIADRNCWGLCRREGLTFTYNGAFWKSLEDDALKRFLMQAAERMGVEAIKAQHHLFGEQLHKQFLVGAYLAPPAPSREVVRVNLQNGTFEVGTERQLLRPPERADFITHQLPFAYLPDATAPHWQAFLSRVLPDESSQLVLAEYLGYLFVHPAKLKLEKVLLLYGSGANGKSVFFEVVSSLLGPENVSNYSLGSLTGNPAYCRAHLATKLVNYASELHGQLEADTFKLLASGEPIEARLPYGQPFILTDYAKLIFNCNELPTEVEHTNAFFRRFLIVPFPVTIPEAEQDKTLAARIISEELAGVFNWVLAGLARLLQNRRFTDCEAARQQVDIFRRQSDSVLMFLEECSYKPSTTAWHPTSMVYQEYRGYCIEGGYRPVARLKFTARLRTAGIEEVRRNTGRGLLMQKEG
jgi:putative DNA primase/helicase